MHNPTAKYLWTDQTSITGKLRVSVLHRERHVCQGPAAEADNVDEQCTCTGHYDFRKPYLRNAYAVSDGFLRGTMGEANPWTGRRYGLKLTRTSLKLVHHGVACSAKILQGLAHRGLWPWVFCVAAVAVLDGSSLWLGPFKGYLLAINGVGQQNEGADSECALVSLQGMWRCSPSSWASLSASRGLACQDSSRCVNKTDSWASCPLLACRHATVEQCQRTAT
jgi:hypothetical protein